MLKENNNGPMFDNPTYLRDTMQLPMTATVSDNCNIIIDVMTEDQLSSMYEMIVQAMRLGEGYGVDEYPSESIFREEMNGGPNFAVLNADTGKMIGGFSLAISKYYRGTELKIADPTIIVRKSDRRRGIGDFVFRTCIQFATFLGYSGIYTDTFSNNIAMKRIIEKKSGFQRVGHLPLGGKMPDGTIVGLYLYYKDLRVTDGSISN